MSEQPLDTVARRVAPALDRRTSLAALGAATLAVAGRPLIADAGKSGNKAKKLCKKQRGPCLAFARNECDKNLECVAAASACCNLLAKCGFAAFIACLNAALSEGGGGTASASFLR